MGVSTTIAHQRAEAAAGTTIEVKIEGLRNAKGRVLVCLTSNASAFPDCSKDAKAIKAEFTTAQAASFRLAAPAQGQYAISLIHDENGNGKLDTRVMMPREGFGFSRNPKISFGPPKFKSASFAVGAATVSQTIKMKYML